MTAYARNSDPETSHASAARLKGAAAHTERIVRFLYENDRPEGWTEFEITNHLGDLGACPWRRITDSRSRGLAEWVVNEDGKMITRSGGSGRGQGASRITEAGKTYCAEAGYTS